MTLDFVKHVTALDDTLAEFEEERASILEQLKALEEKIISLGDNEELLDEIKLIEQSSMYGGDKDLNENGYFNGFSDDKHSPISSLAKKLLSYLDAAKNETEEAIQRKHTLHSQQTYIAIRPKSTQTQDTQKHPTQPVLSQHHTSNIK